MQFSVIALFGLGALVAAAPIEDSLAARSGYAVSCPKGKRSGCQTVATGTAPSGNTDVYANCNGLQIGLLNLVLCDILNDLQLDIPITVSPTVSLLS